MILGKVLGGTIVAVAQGLIFLLLGLTLPILEPHLLSLAALVVFLLVASLAHHGPGDVFRLED